jgi:hypothetical protein
VTKRPCANDKYFRAHQEKDIGSHPYIDLQRFQINADRVELGRGFENRGFPNWVKVQSDRRRSRNNSTRDNIVMLGFDGFLMMKHLIFQSMKMIRQTRGQAMKDLKR